MSSVPAASAYLDNAATTRLWPEALQAMLPWLGECYGNPSGSHRQARRARAAIDEAREQVAACVGCGPGDVVFTSGGTEADNLAVLGVHAARGGRIVCSAVEHHAVLHPVEAVGGFTAPVDDDGIVDLQALPRLLGPGVTLVSVMLANNEVGAVQPLAEVAELTRRCSPEALVHTDAVHGAPSLDLAGAVAPADLVSLSAHKFGGPQGVGVLVVRPQAKLAPVLHGGPQERGRRPGTQNVAGVVGMAAALVLTTERRRSWMADVARRRDRLAAGLRQAVPGLRVTEPAVRVPGTCHVAIEGVSNEELLLLLDDAGVAASAGSSCASGALEPSHVLTAMGWSPDRAATAVRLTVGAATTDAEIDHALEVIPAAVEKLRS